MSAKGLGSDASRLDHTSRVINDLAPSPLPDNHHEVAAVASSARRRKHDAYAMEDLLKSPIVVKPHPSKITTKPRSLQPLMLLPREHLTLACLDLAAPSGDFEYARQYESTVKILDLESRMGNRPVALIARMETTKAVYAIERQASNLYTLCKMGHWVDIPKLSTYATVAHSQLLKSRSVLADATQSEAAATTPQLHKDNKKRRLAMEAIQSLVRRPARSQSISLSAQTVNATPDAPMTGTALLSHATDPVEVVGDHTTAEDVSMSFNDVTPLEEAPNPRTAEEIFDNVRTQYLEALYHSMGSLAYFAKGPLSRARAAFHLDCDSNLEMNELLLFLKSFILTTVQIDKKYRDSVPKIINQSKMHNADSEDNQEPKRKKRKSTKWKLGKDALYPSEDEHVRKWWDANKPQLKDDDYTPTDVSQETRLQISCLRSRETQLQMILILEILALEPLTDTASAVDSQLPSLSVKDNTPQLTKGQLVKKRDKHNFPMLLDVHADRLSIWQTTSLDEIKVMDDSHAGRSGAAQRSDKSIADALKDFCIDIIVPFFSSRLPDRCNLLNQKLGGPVIPSPPKPKIKKAEDFAKPKSKPGAVAKRPATSKPTRTLDCVLSKEVERNRRSISRGPSSMIALMRSATTPLPTLKREASDLVSLTNLPAKNEKDGNISSHHRSSSAASDSARRTTQEEKAKKEAEIEAELQVAISGLRKPNREVVVGRALAEADERKATTSLSQLKKSRKPTEHTGTHGIIKATPAGPRFRNALAKEFHSQPVMGSICETVEAENIPFSSRRIPSTAPRKRNNEAAFREGESSPALPASKQLFASIGATPVKPSLKRSFISAPAGDEGLVLVSSPVTVRKYLAVPGGGLKHRDSGIGMPSSPGGCLAETPVKRPCLVQRGSLEGFVTVTPVKKRAMNAIVATPAPPKLSQEQPPARTLSIYEKLGWDDDYNELL